MKESYASSILFPRAAGPSWTWTRDLAREVNHRTYDPNNWGRINRFFFRSDSSFPNAAYSSPLYCALQVCFACSTLPPYHGKSLWKTPMGRKKKRLRNPPGPTLDTLRSFFKPAPISSHMKKGSNGTIPPSPQNERGDLVVLGLWRCVVRCSIFPLRPNLNLCSRDSCPYTDKGCIDSREERSLVGPPRTARIPRVNRKLDLHWISPESPHLSSWG